MKLSKLYPLIFSILIFVVGCYNKDFVNNNRQQKIIWEDSSDSNSGLIMHEIIEEISSESFKLILNEKNPTISTDKSFNFGSELLSESGNITFKKYLKTAKFGGFGQIDINVVYGDPVHKWYVYWYEYDDGPLATGVMEPFVEVDLSELESVIEKGIYMRCQLTIKPNKIDGGTKAMLDKFGFIQNGTSDYEYLFSLAHNETILMDDLYYKDLTK